MRCLGQIQGLESTEKFVAHLLTLDISTQIESMPDHSDTWEIWVRDEDKLEQAQAELNDFLDSPEAPRYLESLSKASQLLSERERAREQAVKNIRRVESSSRSDLLAGGKIPPLTLTLMILSIVIGVITNFADPGLGNDWGNLILDRLGFVNYDDLVNSNGDPAASLKRWQVWRTVTPIFIHIGPLHLAMNMFMLATFGRLVERWIGTPKYGLMVVVAAVFPNLFQGLSPEWMTGSPNFGGISGVLFCLFGYVWIRTSINPNHGISIPFPMVMIFVGFIVLGLSGVFPALRIANLAHLGGLFVGAALGFASEQGSQ